MKSRFQASNLPPDLREQVVHHRAAGAAVQEGRLQAHPEARLYSCRKPERRGQLALFTQNLNIFLKIFAEWFAKPLVEYLVWKFTERAPRVGEALRASIFAGSVQRPERHAET